MTPTDARQKKKVFPQTKISCTEFSQIGGGVSSENDDITSIEETPTRNAVVLSIDESSPGMSNESPFALRSMEKLVSSDSHVKGAINKRSSNISINKLLKASSNDLNAMSSLDMLQEEHPSDAYLSKGG